jgi:hypothetical protein
LTAAATTDPSTTVASVSYQLDGAKLSDVLATPPYAYAWNTVHVHSGPHILTATVQDGTGATATAQTTVIVLNGIAKPTIKITVPSNRQSVTGTITVQASTTVDPAATIKSVQYMLDGTPLSGLLTTAPYSYPWNTAKSGGVGIHTLQAVVQDSNGVTVKSENFREFVR